VTFKSTLPHFKCLCSQINHHFHRVWRDINATPGAATLEEMAQWEKEFNEAMSAEREEVDQEYDEEIKAQFADLDRDFGLASDMPKVDERGMPILAPYNFGMPT
jgi:hypothetical protein